MAMVRLQQVKSASPVAKGLRLLVVQPTSLCNLNCRYCYVPDRDNPSRMEFATFVKLLDALRCSHLVSRQPEIDLLWHAGEPLTVGIEFYREANQLLNARLEGRWKVRQSIQTNGTLVTPAWCEFFLAEGISVGISLDGPQSIHDVNRPTRGGRSSFDKVMGAVELFRRYAIPVSALCVLTPATLRNPGLVFDFFTSEGITDLAFNVEETEGVHLASALQDQPNFKAVHLYSTFMREFLRLNRAAGFPLRVREFHALAQNIKLRRLDPDHVPHEAEQIVGEILTMTRDGVLTSWSPELASAAPNELGKFALGHVGQITSLDELLETHRARAIQTEIDAGIKRCQRECEYFGVCGGGSPANKIYENNSFATTHTLKCSLQIKALMEVLLAEFGNNAATN